MEKKQTAVEWFNEWVLANHFASTYEWEKKLQEAKEMEKQQITQAFSDGKYYSHDYFDEQNPYANQAQNYYNETYNKNL